MSPIFGMSPTTPRWRAPRGREAGADLIEVAERHQITLVTWLSEPPKIFWGGVRVDVGVMVMRVKGGHSTPYLPGAGDRWAGLDSGPAFVVQVSASGQCVGKIWAALGLLASMFEASADRD